MVAILSMGDELNEAMMKSQLENFKIITGLEATSKWKDSKHQ